MNTNTQQSWRDSFRAFAHRRVVTMLCGSPGSTSGLLKPGDTMHVSIPLAPLEGERARVRGANDTPLTRSTPETGIIL